jgi:molybdopterin molybdotransferase
MSHVEPSWHEAREIAHSCVERLPTEHVRLIEAHGLMTTEDVKALTPLPPSAVSAMDGWAVAGHGPWVVIGQVLAGAVWPTPLVAGQAVRIATGAALPLGCDGVLRSEDGLIDKDGSVRGRVRSGGDVRRAGEESHAGEVLIHAGSIMTPARIGLAAAGGHDTASVRRRPIVRLLVLGDEILAEGPARDGRVRDSLGPQLPGWLVRLGVDLVETVHVEDTFQEQSAALVAAVEAADLVITTGGTAAGPADHLRAAIAATGGSLIVDQVACRPGHPMLLAGWAAGGRLVALPGNPLAAIVALLTLGQPLAAGLKGHPLDSLPGVRLGDFVSSQGAKTRLVPCRREGERVFPMEHIGSGMLRGLADADGFAVVAAGEGEPGSSAEWLELP